MNGSEVRFRQHDYLARSSDFCYGMALQTLGLEVEAEFLVALSDTGFIALLEMSAELSLLFERF